MSRGVRLQKYLSRAGVASRRKSEELMRQGRVRVNGSVVTEMGARIDPTRDRVEVDGRSVEVSAPRWVLFHKPSGCLTTREDPRGRTTVYDLLPEEMAPLKYVGRLDQGTEGLLLLTNEGGMIHALTHPSNQVQREYRALVRGRPSEEALRRLRAGVELQDGMARAERLRVVRETERGAVLALVLREGRKREVRRLLKAVGHPVRRLKRVRFGPVGLGQLARGEWRELTPEEVKGLEAASAGE